MIGNLNLKSMHISLDAWISWGGKGMPTGSIDSRLFAFKKWYKQRAFVNVLMDLSFTFSFCIAFSIKSKS